MSGRHSFQELSREFMAERRQRIDAIKRELLAEMPPASREAAGQHTIEEPQRQASS